MYLSPCNLSCYFNVKYKFHKYSSIKLKFHSLLIMENYIYQKIMTKHNGHPGGFHLPKALHNYAPRSQVLELVVGYALIWYALLVHFFLLTRLDTVPSSPISYKLIRG